MRKLSSVVAIIGSNGMWLHWCLQVDKLENIALKQLFDRNEQRVKVKPKRLYQRVSAQFCDLICRVGFQKEFAPPAGNTHVKSFRIIIRFLYSSLKAFLVKVNLLYAFKVQMMF